MKQILLLVVAMLTAATLQAGGLHVSEMSIAYGSIKEGPPVIKTIVLSNTGTTPLVINNVRAS